MRTPDHDVAPAWQKQSRMGAGREFVFWFGNAYQEQEVINIHYFVNLPSV